MCRTHLVQPRHEDCTSWEAYTYAAYTRTFVTEVRRPQLAVRFLLGCNLLGVRSTMNIDEPSGRKKLGLSLV